MEYKDANLLAQVTQPKRITVRLHGATKHRNKRVTKMKPESLKSWRERLFGTGYGTRSKQTAAKALGLSQRAYDSYEAGEHRIPRYIELACTELTTKDFLGKNAIEISDTHYDEMYDFIREMQTARKR